MSTLIEIKKFLKTEKKWGRDRKGNINIPQAASYSLINADAAITSTVITLIMTAIAPIYPSIAMTDTTLALCLYFDINTTACDDRSYCPGFIDCVTQI